MVTARLKGTLGAVGGKARCSRRGPYQMKRWSHDDDVSGEVLSSKFSQFLNENDVSLCPRQPSHLLSPTAVVECQMAALQRNDWPEMDAGIQTAFAFTKPYDVEHQPSLGEQRCRTWFAEETWLTMDAFSEMMHAHPYSRMIDFPSWKVNNKKGDATDGCLQPLSEMIFPSRRADAAVQAVMVRTHRSSTSHQFTEFPFTFCLERIPVGSYKNCWMTVGVRVGDYSS